jgi:hypothetical protein
MFWGERMKIIRMCVPILGVIFAACAQPAPSTEQIQTAIAETQAALPPTKTSTLTSTATHTPTNTQTATVTPSSTFTLEPTLTISPTATITVAMTISPHESATITSSSTPNGEDIPWDEVKNHTGEYGTVCGPVMGAYYARESKGEPTFLNLGAEYPDEQRVSVLIWGDYRYNFQVEPEKYYLEKWVCVYGFIYSYQGISTIEIYEPAQIHTD